MSFTHCDQEYLKSGREMWLEVAKNVARAKGVPEDSPQMRRVRADVMMARTAIGLTAQKIVPKSNQIEDFHILVGSTPPRQMITRRHFLGLSPQNAAHLVTDHLASGKSPEQIGPVIAPYFECGRPIMHMKLAA